jgi:hypothetical protein
MAHTPCQAGFEDTTEPSRQRGRATRAGPVCAGRGSQTRRLNAGVERRRQVRSAGCVASVVPAPGGPTWLRRPAAGASASSAPDLGRNVEWPSPSTISTWDGPHPGRRGDQRRRVPASRMIRSMRRDWVQEAAADPAVRALLVSGAGRRAFCAGADVKDARELTGDGTPDLGIRLREIYNPVALAVRPHRSPSSPLCTEHAVVDIMRELSQQHTMALPFGVLDQELDLALQRRFGVPVEPRRQQVYRIDLRHIAGDRMEWPELDFSARPEVAAAPPPGVLGQLVGVIRELVENELLRAGRDTYREMGPDHAESDHAAEFVDFENKVAATIQRHGLASDAIDLAVGATDLCDIRPAVGDAPSNVSA